MCRNFWFLWMNFLEIFWVVWKVSENWLDLFDFWVNFFESFLNFSENFREFFGIFWTLEWIFWKFFGFSLRNFRKFFENFLRFQRFLNGFLSFCWFFESFLEVFIENFRKFVKFFGNLGHFLKLFGNFENFLKFFEHFCWFETRKVSESVMGKRGTVELCYSFLFSPWSLSKPAKKIVCRALEKWRKNIATENQSSSVTENQSSWLAQVFPFPTLSPHGDAEVAMNWFWKQRFSGRTTQPPPPLQANSHTGNSVGEILELKICRRCQRTVQNV